MGREDVFHIIGGGPAGAGAAVAAAKAGFKPVIYEVHDRLAVKPCGRGIPVVGDLWFARIPGDAVLNRIKSAVMFINGEFLFELRGVFEGYIVDKARLLEAVITSSGGEIMFRSRFLKDKGSIKTPRGEVKPVRGVFAGGHPYYEGLTIGAVQWILRNNRLSESETLEIYFDTELMGYYYVFPHGQGEIEVGVGGFEDLARLRARLERFIKSREDLASAERVKLEGARIALGGLRLGWMSGLVKAGESAGFVLPLTGEGIRPSMISGFIAARALAEGRDPVRELERSSIARAIRVQKAILDFVLRLSPRERAEVLKSLTPRAHAEIALGRLNYKVLLMELAKSPGAAAKLLKVIKQT